MTTSNFESVESCVSKKLKLALNAARMHAYERNLKTGIVTKSYIPVYREGETFPSLERLFETGPSVTSMRYEDSERLIVVDDRARIREAVDRAIADGSEFEIEFRMYDGEGGLRWRQSNGRAFYDADGTPSYVYAVTQDITQKKRLETNLRARSAELAETRDQLSIALEAAGMAAFKSFGGGSEVLSPAMRRLLGLPADDTEMTLENFLSHVHPADREMVLLSIATRKERVEDEFRVIYPNGEVHWLLAKGSSAFGNSDSVNAYIVLQDITERKISEEQLRRKTEELTEANKKLERFSAVVAHDLKGPLSTMIMSADLVDTADSLEESREAVRYIRDGGNRMVALVDDLLTLAKSGPTTSLEQGPVALNEVIETVRSNLRSALTSKQALLTIEPVDAHVHGHFGQLTQVFQNLIANSLKFIATDLPHVHISFTDKKDTWLIAIKDNGVGMDATAATRLFQPFQRFHASQFEGTGLGLSIVKNIIDRHSGKIWVESRPGHGSVFYFTIPKAGAALALASEERELRA